jgi:hypothetical protein
MLSCMLGLCRQQSQKSVPDHQRTVLSCTPALPAKVYDLSNPLGPRTFISQPSLFREPTIDMLRLVWKQSNLVRPFFRFGSVGLCGTLIARKLL